MFQTKIRMSILCMWLCLCGAASAVDKGYHIPVADIFRDTTLDSLTQGDWVGWVGAYDDIVQGKEGQYRVRLMNNQHAWDCAYPGVEVLPDGTFVTTTYGHWSQDESPHIVSVRFRLEELDAMVSELGIH